MRGLLILYFIFCLIPGSQNSPAQMNPSLFQPFPERPAPDEKVPYPGSASPEQAEEMSKEGMTTIVLEHSGEERLSYRNFKIKNTKAGLTVSKNGKRLLFIRNRSERWIGMFGLKNLLGAKGKQLIYLTGPDGMHCCNLFFIVDLTSARPRLIFDSEKYQVQGNLDIFFHLGIFDAGGDGKMEIIQEAGGPWDNNCAYVSRTRVEAGFTYDSKAKKYLPLKAFTPYQQNWNKKYQALLERSNAAIKAGQNPEESGCGYDQIARTIAYSYLYVGKEKEALGFLRKNYLSVTYDDNGDAHFDPAATKKNIKKYIAEIRREARWNKLYRAVYRR